MASASLRRKQNKTLARYYSVVSCWLAASREQILRLGTTYELCTQWVDRYAYFVTRGLGFNGLFP